MVAGVTLSRIRKRFGNVEVLRGIDVVVPSGAYVCLLGPSGCGKSTLLRMIAGLEAVTEGVIEIDGRRVDHLEPAERGIGLAFPLRAPRWRGRYDEAEVARRVAAMAELLHIEPYLDRAVGALSGGQKQRVALGRALIREPEVLLLDEPITHLDARLRHEMRAELKLLHQRLGTTTIHVTHDQLEAMAVADLIVVMREGLVEQIGSPDEIYRQPATPFVATFIGDPPMSLVAGRFERRGSAPVFVMPAGVVAVSQAAAARFGDLEGRDVQLAIRSHAVTLGTDGIVMRVAASEWVGREQQVTATAEQVTLRARVPSSEPIRVGETVRVSIDLTDSRSGRPADLSATFLQAGLRGWRDRSGG
jgi:ABC-type sugar transport system ATPase subunit